MSDKYGKTPQQGLMRHKDGNVTRISAGNKTPMGNATTRGNLAQFLSEDEQKPKPTRADFDVKSSSTPLVNKPSVSVSAAKAVMLGSEGNPIAEYQQIVQEFDETGGSDTAKKLTKAYEEQSREAAKDLVTAELGNPLTPMEQKEALAKQWIESNKKELEVNKMLADKALEEDSDNLDPVQEDDRFQAIETFKDAEAVRQMRQKITNSLNTKISEGGIANVADFAEAMAPYAEQGLFANVAAKLRSDDITEIVSGFALLGSNKARMREWFQNLTTAQQLEIMPKIAKIAQESSSVVFADGNQMLAADFFQSIVDKNGYTTTDKWIDNAVSILDLAGLGWSVKGVPKLIKTGKKLDKVGKPVDEVVDEAADKVVDTPAAPVKDKPFVEDAENAAQDEYKLIPPKQGEKPVPDSAVEERGVTDFVTENSNPQAPYGIVKDVNPGKGRAIHKAAELDETGEIAQTLMGMGRTDALAHANLPQPGNSAGLVTTKPLSEDMLVAQLRGIDDSAGGTEAAIRLVEKSGEVGLSDAEKASDVARVAGDFEDPTGIAKASEEGFGSISSKVNMNTIEALPDGARINMTYGRRGDAGWANAAEAAIDTQIALRNYGIAPSNVQVLSRRGGDLVPVDDGADITKLPRGSYFTQVSYDYKHDYGSLREHNLYEKPENFKTTFLNRYFHGNMMQAGSLTSHLLDPASLMDDLVTASAAVAVDKSARFSQILGKDVDRMTIAFNKLPADRRAHLTNLWREANFKGLKIDESNYLAKNLSDAEFEIHKDWRRIWDALYHLDNADLRKTFRRKGYKLYTGTDKSNLYVRPKTLAQLKTSIKAYDPIKGHIRTFTAKELDRIYDNGGEVGELAAKVKFGDGEVNKVVSYNNNGGFIRSINDEDMPLNYREGYYAVQYQDPWFVKRRRKGGGADDWVAVGTAKNRTLADRGAESLSKGDDDRFEYQTFHDRNLTTDADDERWQAATAGKKSSQRLRGETLGSYNGNEWEAPHLASPAEALEAAIESASNRVNLRDWLDMQKERFMAAYEGTDVLLKNDGKYRYPKTIDEIQGTSKEAATARTLHEYIRTMENGWANHADDLTKAAFNKLGDIVGGHDNAFLDWTEEFMRNRSKGQGPTGYGKKKVFQMYLALNPLRQIVVQSHQMVQITGLQPGYMLKGGLVRDSFVLTQAMHLADGKTLNFVKDKLFQRALKSMNIKEADAVEMVNDWNASGLSAAVNQHNLVRSNQEYATRGDFFNKTGRLVDKGMDKVQKVGFDAGERANMVTAWLAFRNRAINRGLDMKNATVIEKVAADARNFTLNMNRAGDMPYNQNALGVALQFLQVPHKATTQVLFNKSLTGWERGRMAAWNIMMYGIPTAYLIEEYMPGMMPEDPELRQALHTGAETWILNEVLSAIEGDEVDVDFTNLSAWDSQGFTDVIQTFMTDGVVGAVMNSPAMSLATTRIPPVFNSAARLFNLQDDSEESPETIGDTALQFARIASGFKNMHESYKILYANKVKEKLNKRGDKAYAASTSAAILQAFGFSMLKETESYEHTNRVYKTKNDTRDMVREWYSDYKTMMAAKGKPKKYYEEIAKTYNEFWRVVGRNEVTDRMLLSLINRDAKDGDDTFAQVLNQMAGLMSTEELKSLILTNPDMDSDRKKVWMEWFTRGREDE